MGRLLLKLKHLHHGNGNPKMRKKHDFVLILFSLIFLSLLRFFANKNQIIQIPISFTPAGIPLVSVKIEGSTHFLELDIGSKCELSLDQNVLDHIQNKKPSGTIHWRDIKGNFYESPSYLIPRLEIEGLVLKDVVASQENMDFRRDTTLWNDKKNEQAPKKQFVGNLGRLLLEKTNLLIDFKNLSMFACNNKRELNKAGFFLDHMTQIPFEGGMKGIIMKVDTEAGVLRLGLDTGSTVTLIRASRLQDQKSTKDNRGFSVYTSRSFVIGNKDFGPKNLLLYEITPELNEIDGILGMDFLKNHILYIDYKDKVIYIENSQPKGGS